MSFSMDSLHQAFLITGAEIICKRIGLSCERIDRHKWLINNQSFNLKEMLEYVYRKEAK